MIHSIIIICVFDSKVILTVIIVEHVSLLPHEKHRRLSSLKYGKAASQRRFHLSFLELGNLVVLHMLGNIASKASAMMIHKASSLKHGKSLLEGIPSVCFRVLGRECHSRSPKLRLHDSTRSNSYRVDSRSYLTTPDSLTKKKWQHLYLNPRP